MKNLKDLTPEECIKIATIAEPNVEWKFIQSENKWNGFDLIGVDDNENDICKNIFQIVYNDVVEFGKESRFRIYVDLCEFPIDDDKLDEINNYLKTL